VKCQVHVINVGLIWDEVKFTWGRHCRLSSHILSVISVKLFKIRSSHLVCKHVYVLVWKIRDDVTVHQLWAPNRWLWAAELFYEIWGAGTLDLYNWRWVKCVLLCPVAFSPLRYRCEVVWRLIGLSSGRCDMAVGTAAAPCYATDAIVTHCSEVLRF